jgi:DNA-binding SARP family transcriptional activator/tetratricopeptide (TPR) repeat protein
MDFSILGPLEVRIEGKSQPLTNPKQRTLLAILLLHANEIVSSDRLIDELWGERPPDTAANTLQVYVSQLRKVLGHTILLTRRPGYVLNVGDDELDAARFERLVAEAKGASPERAGGLLREALAIWRGPALADFTFEPFAETEIARLEEVRLAAIEDRIEADLALGSHAGLVGELESLISQHPFRERLRGQLMLALYRSGRQAEALRAYHDTRLVLVEELGIEPSPALQRLEKAILVQDAALELEPSARAAPAAMAPAESEPPPVEPWRETLKTVTVVFANLSPSHGEAMDPEALRRIVGQAVDTARRVFVHHGATVGELVDGRLLAVFGIPAAHEDDALRALRATAELRDELAARTRVGVNTGEVLVEEGGRRDVSGLTGEAVHVAARLERLATSDDVLIGAATERLVRHAVHVEPLDARAGETLTAFRLLQVFADAPSISRRLDTPMIGRRTELEQLRLAFEHATLQRTCSLFTILGPAGIGKSRLATEFRAEMGTAATTLAGRCLPYGDGITYWPLVEIVRQIAGEGERDALVAHLAGEDDADTIADRVAGAVGLGDKPADAAEIAWAFRKLLEVLAQTRPLVVFFDDMQWAEATFLQLVEHVADWSRDAPILLVCLARSEFLDLWPAWGGGKVNATSILLEPLSDNESDLLIDSLAADAAISEETRGGIRGAADGNPLFVEQMLAMLSENGAAEKVIPPSIQALLAARLDQLDAEEHAVLERASVVGKEFWTGAVSDLSNEEEREGLQGALRALVRKELIRPEGASFLGEHAFRFRHQLIRDVAYESLPKERRADLHERFADWLERRAGDRTTEVEEILGYHLEQAVRYWGELGIHHDRASVIAPRAAERLLAAGYRAFARGDMPAAISLLSRSADLFKPDEPKRFEVLPDLGEAYRSVGQLERARELAEEAEAWGRAAGSVSVVEHARLVGFRLDLVRADADLTKASAEIERSIRALERVGDDHRLSLAWYLAAWVAWTSCRAGETTAALERSFEHAREAHDWVPTLHLYVGTALFGPLPVPEAIARCEEAIARSGNARRVLAAGLRAIAGLNAMAGEFRLARELVERDRAILADLGLRVTQGSAEGLYGEVFELEGDLDGAEREFRAGCRIFDEIGDASSFSTLAALLAAVLYRQERFDESLDWNERSARSAAREDLHTQIPVRSTRAKLLARDGAYQEAERLGRGAVDLAGKTDFLNFQGRALLDLAEVFQLAGRLDEASREAEAAAVRFERKGNVVLARRARERLRQVAVVL